MSSFGKTFTAGTVGEFDGPRPVAEGWQDVVVQSAEIRCNSKGTGDVLKLVYRIESGADEGRNLYHYFNISNPSEKAEEIARKELGSVIAAARLNEVRYEADLLDARLQVLVTHEQYQGKIQCRIAGTDYARKQDAQPPAQARRAPAQARRAPEPAQDQYDDDIPF